MKKSSHIRRIPYIRIGVSDLKKSVSFYQDVLGLEKISEWSTGAIFDISGVELGLESKAKPQIFLLVDDVDKAYRDLKDKGLEFVTEPKDQPWGGRTAAFLTMTETCLKSSHSNAKSVASFVRVIASFLKST